MHGDGVEMWAVPVSSSELRCSPASWRILSQLFATPVPLVHLSVPLPPPRARPPCVRGQLVHLAHVPHALTLPPSPPRETRSRTRRSWHSLAHGRQLISEPLTRLFPPARPLGLAELPGIFPQAAACQCRGAGGIVAVANVRVIGELRIRRQSIGIQFGRSEVQ